MATEEEEKRKEEAWVAKINSPVPDHPAEGQCGECGAPLKSLEEAIAHFDSRHRLGVDVKWAT